MWSGGFFRRERIIFARKIRLDMAEPRKTGRRTSARAKVNVPEEDAYGHVQPQALEFEEAVLGALMIEQDAYSQVSEILRPESFYDHRHQLIYEAIRTLNLQQKPVDGRVRQPHRYHEQSLALRSLYPRGEQPRASAHDPEGNVRSGLY